MPRILKTVNYDLFLFMDDNRDVSEAHVRALIKESEVSGNLTELDPIKVNEEMEVIDGQHRLLATKELGLPIYYVVRPGLTIVDALNMNIHHRAWTSDDYAKTYSKRGNQSYTLYLALRDEFGFPHRQTLAAISGSQGSGSMKRFSTGRLSLTEERFAEVRADLAQVYDLQEALGRKMGAVLFAALLRTIHIDNYDHTRMLDRLSTRGSTLSEYLLVTDALRALEEVYNYHFGNAGRTRLY